MSSLYFRNLGISFSNTDGGVSVSTAPLMPILVGMAGLAAGISVWNANNRITQNAVVITCSRLIRAKLNRALAGNALT